MEILSEVAKDPIHLNKQNISQIIFENISNIRAWMADCEGNYCHGCHSKFQFLLLRKHHCRFCGFIYCDQCTKFRLSFYYRISKMEDLMEIDELDFYDGYRSCKKCYDRFYSAFTSIATTRSSHHTLNFSRYRKIHLNIISKKSIKFACIVFMEMADAKLSKSNGQTSASVREEDTYETPSMMSLQNRKMDYSWSINWVLNILLIKDKSRRSTLSTEYSKDTSMGMNRMIRIKSTTFPINSSSATDPFQECPICFERFLILNYEDDTTNEEHSKDFFSIHVENCLKSIAENKLSFVGDRYSTFLYVEQQPSMVCPCPSREEGSLGALNDTADASLKSEESTDSSEVEILECTICYDEFKKGEKIALLNCLCKFHKDCIDRWFCKGKGCPFHPNHFELFH